MSKYLRRWMIALVFGGIAVGLASLPTPWWRSRWRHHRAETLNCPSHMLDIAVSEASGITFHPDRNTLLVVSDQGTVVEMDLQYKVLDEYDIFGDIEAVTVHPATGTLFVASESDGTILEYDLDHRRVLRTLVVDFASAPEFANGLTMNEGLESVTFLTDDRGGHQLVSAVQSHPARLIFLGADVSTEATQQARQRTDRDRAVGVKQVVPILYSQDIELARISDVLFDPESRTFLITSAGDRTLTICDPRGRTLRTIQLPGKKPEGLCFLPNGDGLVVEDTGGIWFVEKFRSALIPIVRSSLEPCGERLRRVFLPVFLGGQGHNLRGTLRPTLMGLFDIGGERPIFELPLCVTIHPFATPISRAVCVR